MTEPFPVATFATITFLYIERCGSVGIGFKVREALARTVINFVHRRSSLRARGLGPSLELFPCWGMCYNRPAVEHAVKPGAAPVRPERAERASSRLAPRAEHTAMASSEDASRYCPVCSQRLESRRCKLICPVCGYYMSCADYY